MTPGRWSDVERIFTAAVHLPPEEQARVLAERCGGDERLAREVASLLAADGQAAPFLDAPVLALRPAVEPAALAPGSRLGPYRLLSELGRGGMSVVYLARRDDERYDREVAVKVCRGGIEGSSLPRRFAGEGRILARLEHPSIARLYDADSTESGVPYFVLERVDGLRIDDYCELHGLAQCDRVRIFIAVCAAVHYAHQRLIVHRDLKPRAGDRSRPCGHRRQGAAT